MRYAECQPLRANVDHAAPSLRLTYSTNPPACTMPITLALSGGKANLAGRTADDIGLHVDLNPLARRNGRAAAGQTIASSPLLSALR